MNAITSEPGVVELTREEGRKVEHLITLLPFAR